MFEDQSEQQPIEQDPFLKCKYCDLKFENLDERKIHQVNEHTHEKEAFLKCRYCSLKFFTLDDRKAHYAELTEEQRQSLKCSYCFMQFCYENDKVTHQAQEHGNEDDKKFVCNACGKEHPTRKQLIRHQYNHKCVYCPMSFCMEKDRVAHQDAAHSNEEDKKFKCNTCGKFSFIKYFIIY